ncbi:MAG: cell division protein FtsQ/DivIB [Prevotellaceae bacterium]|jgi:cell division protein FtsQ|nr:cell division protein FtsQ/DivIB [Prevotellaceae bacterium]
MAKKRIAWERIVLAVAVLGIATSLIIYLSVTKGSSVCKGIDVKITNSEVAKLITAGDIKRMIEQSKIAGKGKPLNDGVIKKTLKFVETRGSVKNVLVYQTGDSILHVELEQRIPSVRILTSAGSCYLDKEGISFPVSERYAYNVPLVTGKIRLPAEGKMMSDTFFARNLPAFAEFVSGNPFWNAQIQQIDIDENRNIQFTVCSDNHLIRLGQLYEYEKKMNNLLTFYMKVNPYYLTENDVPYTVLDLRFDRQIVAVTGN